MAISPRDKSAPPIVLLTDFGYRDHYVGVMKGVIAAIAPLARIIDLTHGIAPQAIAAGALALEQSWRYFPPRTIFVAVVDPGVGTGRLPIAVETAAGARFIGPDNGLLWNAVEQAGLRRAVELRSPRYRLPEVSATFHGRDIFAPIAAELAAGHCVPADLGERQADLMPAWVDEPTIERNAVSGVVITQDHFGNLITNIDGDLLKGMETPTVHAGNHTFELLRTYGDTQPGQYLALVNSFGVVEIARAEQSAADGLGLGLGAPVVIRPKS